MILVLETNGSILYLYPDVAEAESHLEAIDFENGEYEFCDDTGQRFVGEIITPVGYFRAGSFRLRPDGEPGRNVFTSIVSRAGSLDGECEGIRTLDDLRKTHLA